MVNVFAQIYLWILIIVCACGGIVMTCLLIHQRHTPSNSEATENWLNEIQTWLLVFVIVMAILGVILMILMF